MYEYHIEQINQKFQCILFTTSTTLIQVMQFEHALKTRLKRTQLEKVHLINMNELQLTQVELF